MNLQEFKKAIIASKNPEWFNIVEFDLEFPLLNTSLSFKGFASLKSFINKELTYWSKIKQPRELLTSKTYFESVSVLLDRFVSSYSHLEHSNELNSSFHNSKSQIERDSKNFIFPSNCPELDFLLKVNNERPQNFQGAYGYMTRNLNQNLNDIDVFTGVILAYEFQLKNSEITNRRNIEKASLTRLTTDFKNTLPDLEKELVAHLDNNKKVVSEHISSIEQFKEDKEKLYSDWFINAKGEYQGFSKSSSEKLADLEKVYAEKLKLEEPAKYWSMRGKKLKKQGWISLSILVSLVLIIIFSLGELLWNTPQQIFNSFFGNDKSAAIRWSIIYITFISFMAFCIKAVSKVMFSSFHLARDCEERYTLTYFYLSLLKDSNVGKEEKQLIMQSLFSRAETGLLKDDSSPTMPNDVIGKLFNK